MQQSTNCLKHTGKMMSDEVTHQTAIDPCIRNFDKYIIRPWENSFGQHFAKSRLDMVSLFLSDESPTCPRQPSRYNKLFSKRETSKLIFGGSVWLRKFIICRTWVRTKAKTRQDKNERTFYPRYRATKNREQTLREMKWKSWVGTPRWDLQPPATGLSTLEIKWQWGRWRTSPQFINWQISNVSSP